MRIAVENTKQKLTNVIKPPIQDDGSQADMQMMKEAPANRRIY